MKYIVGGGENLQEGLLYFGGGEEIKVGYMVLVTSEQS